MNSITHTARIMLASFLLFNSIICVADSLKRAPLLGVIPTQNQAGEPVVLQRLLPDSTASKLGLLAGDKILSLNEHAITDFSVLIKVLQGIQVGDKITVKVLRNKLVHTTTGTLQPRPYEVSNVADVLYESVQYKDNKLRTIVYKPTSLKAGETAPAIFFIQGYTCDSIDYGMAPNLTTRQMVNQYAAAGYVVFRIEKPGMGDSQSKQHCSQIDFTAESHAFLHGLRALKQKEYVNPEQVYLWGHSLGVLYSTVVANQEKVAGVIGYGGVLKPWYDYLLDIYQVQSVKHFDTPESVASRNTAQIKPFLNMWLNTNMNWQDVISSDKSKAAISANLLPLNNEQIFHRHFSFFRDLNRYNLSDYWEKLTVPVLMIHGSLDIQAIDEKWAFDIAKLTPHQKSKAMVIDGAEHAFMHYKNRQAHMDDRNEGNYNPAKPNGKFDKRIGEATLKWISRL